MNSPEEAIKILEDFINRTNQTISWMKTGVLICIVGVWFSGLALIYVILTR